MGCSLCKKQAQAIEETNETIVTPLFNVDDLNQKRKLAIFLVENDYKMYHSFLSEIKNMDDKEFKNLFEGNTNYKFNNSSPRFKELVQKFEDNYEFISEWYNKDDYYKYMLPLWKCNIIQQLKGKDKEEQEKILKNNGIETSNWNSEFRNHFQSIIIKSQKDLSESLKNYIEADFGDFDEYVKISVHCKQNIENNEETKCGKILISNLETNMYNLLKKFVPGFYKSYLDDLKNMPNDLKNKQEEAAIQKLIDSGISENKSKALIQKLMKKYEKNKYTGKFEPNKELKNVKDFSIKFNKGQIDELRFKDKANIFFSNNMIKHATLGISIITLSYSILHLDQRFNDYENFKQEIVLRLRKIRQSFQNHKGQVSIIPKDVDEAAEYIKKLNAEFHKDLEEVNLLISDINDAINKQKTERNKSIFQLLFSAVGSGTGIFATVVTKDISDKIEYGTSSFFQLLSTGVGAVDIAAAQKIIKELKAYLDEAKDLEKKILEQIDILRKEFDKKKIAHFPV